MADDIVSKALVGAVLGGIFALIAWQLNRNKRVKREQKNKQPNADKVAEGPSDTEGVSEQERSEPIEKQTELPSITQLYPTRGISLEKETKKCPYCAEIIKIEAKKCRFCGQVYTQKEMAQLLQKIEQQKIDDKLGISLENETKKCPMCAETIKLLSEKCELCGEIFDPVDVGRQIEARRYALISLKTCPKCGHHDVYPDYTGSFWCPHCNKYVLRNERG